MVLYYNIKKPVPEVLPEPEPELESIEKNSKPIKQIAYTQNRGLEDILNDIFHSDLEMYYEMIDQSSFSQFSQAEKLNVLHRQNNITNKVLSKIKTYVMILILMLAIIIFKLYS